MKAIIMAGGEGSRLRPLTCNRPKPMMPVMNEPMMAHIVKLLKKYDLTDIGVTLQYMPDAIRDYFRSGADWGVNLRYFIEEEPLGTGGSVKNASDFLDETFIVISGDALTDFDLSEAIKFHRKNNALATLVLKQVPCPLEYGVVITEKKGKVTQFLEKPGWGEVFSDTVNTGIYILEPSVLNYFPHGQKFDFSKDLFPLLLKEKKNLFGVSLEGYWCDIGNIHQYVQAHQDVLQGKVRLSFGKQKMKDDIWLGQGVTIDPTAEINGPVLLGNGCQVGKNAKIEPYSILGDGCCIEANASIKRSILGDGVYLGTGASVRGAVLGGGVKLYAHAVAYEGAVLGDDTTVRERGIIKPDVKLWPNKVVEMGATVNRSIIWGHQSPKNIFGLEGVTGLGNVEINPEFAARLGAAFGSTLDFDAQVLVTSDEFVACKMIKEAFVSGLQSIGTQVLDGGVNITPVHRQAIKNLALAGGVHVKISSYGKEKLSVVFSNRFGGTISRGAERKIENKLVRGDFRRYDCNKIVKKKTIGNLAENYLKELYSEVDLQALAKGNYHLLLACGSQMTLGILQEIAIKGQLLLEEFSDSDRDNVDIWYQRQEVLPLLGQEVKARGLDAAALLEPNGEKMVLIDDLGRIIEEDLFSTLLALVMLKDQMGPVVVPVTAPGIIDKLANKYHGAVIRTKTSTYDFLQQSIEAETMLLHFDAITALVKILEYCANQQLKISNLVDEIPAFFMDKRKVPVSWQAKGRVIRTLIEEKPNKMELTDGVKVFHNNGWALVLPDPEEPICRIYTEGASMEIAQELTDMYVHKINDLADQSYLS